MSMINDALKRAKNAQEKTSGHCTPDRNFFPVDPLVPSPRGIGMILPMFVVLFVFMSFLFVWQTRQQVSATEPKAKVRAEAPVNPAPKPITIAMVAPKPAVVPKPVLTVTNAPIVAEEPPPKLQAIFFAPRPFHCHYGWKNRPPGGCHQKLSRRCHHPKQRDPHQPHPNERDGFEAVITCCRQPL